jgi:hypothetical protein
MSSVLSNEMSEGVRLEALKRSNAIPVPPEEGWLPRLENLLIEYEVERVLLVPQNLSVKYPHRSCSIPVRNPPDWQLLPNISNFGPSSSGESFDKSESVLGSDSSPLSLCSFFGSSSFESSLESKMMS